MSILSTLKALIYDWLVRNHIPFYLTPILAPIHFFSLIKFTKADYLTDESGNTMKVTKYNGRTYPCFGEKRFSTIKDIQIRDDDIMLCSYPKTGTHFAYEILYMLRMGKAKLSPFGKGAGGMIDSLPNFMIDSIHSPRILNSHLLYDELPSGIEDKNNKIVLTVRCPKDTAVSFFNHTKTLEFFYKYKGKFDDHFRMFMKGELDYGSYFDYYLSWDKVHKVKKTDGNNQIFVLRFEDLKENTVQTIKELAQFLDIQITEEFAEEIAKVSSFSNVKKKRPKDILMRKGEVGDWKNWLTDEQKAEVDLVWREKMADFRMGTMRDGYKKSGNF